MTSASPGPTVGWVGKGFISIRGFIIEYRNKGEYSRVLLVNSRGTVGGWGETRCTGGIFLMYSIPEGNNVTLTGKMTEGKLGRWP